MTRFRHRDGSLLHVAYCSNVHPAEDLHGVIAQLRRFAAPLRERLESERLGVGLWLAAPLARRLRGEGDGVARLKDALQRLRLEVVTLNGFPYRAFHAPVVKRAVYEPDWTSPLRAQYTLDLAALLAQLLPEDVEEGSISTLPLGWREGWGEAQGTAARKALAEVAVELRRLHESSGKRVRLAIEPEPGCAVETVPQAIATLQDLDRDWVGLCLDACHLAVQFERPQEVEQALLRTGTPAVKMQVSAALRARAPDPGELRSFAEPRFLHQVRAQTREGVIGVDDLPEALAGGLPQDREWRVHFHVPVHLDGGITTQPQLRELLDRLLGGPQALTRHVELETYTWEVMPGALRPSGEDAPCGKDAQLIEGLAQELRWLDGELERLGLEPA
jgi:hypothetical protein